MAQGHARGTSSSRADYDALYRGDTGLDEAGLSFDGVPWDIGIPQPAVVRLERAGEFRSQILDLGCGTGDNAVFLAQRGYAVTGVDSAPAALHDARTRAETQDIKVRFVQDDATSLRNLEPTFDTVLDSALYHCLEQKGRKHYSAALHRVTRPGAVLHLFCFADEGPGCFPAPFQVSKHDLHSNLSKEWDIFSIDLGSYVSQLTRRDLEVLSFQNTGFPQVSPSESEVDEQGRILTPVWRLRARRRS